MNISLFKLQKRGFTYMQVLTWRAGPAGELTWRAGPPHGCDVALRPCGRAAGGPREAHGAHRARTRGRRPRVSTGPCGCQCGAPHGKSGRQLEGPRV